MKFLLTTLCCAMSVGAMAADGYVKMAQKGVSVGVNPAGTYVFGYNGRSGDDSQQSWLYDVDTKTTTLYPDPTAADPETAGQVMWLTSDLTAVGTFRDPQWATTVNDGIGGYIDDYPLNSACIWKGGERFTLDHNRWEDVTAFVGQDGTRPNGGNGFYAMRISEDETTIVGYLKAFSYMLPVRWELGDEGFYTSTMLHRETGQFFYYWVGASADCRRVILNDGLTDGVSYIWDGDDAPWVFTYSEPVDVITNPSLTALSPSGRYAIMSCSRNGVPAYGVYDFETASVSWIPVPEGAASTNWFAANVVTDRRDGFICDYNYQLHYFNIDLGINIPFASYLQAFGSELNNEGSGLSSKALVRMVSEDGRTICGNNIQFSLEYTGWMVRLPDKQPMLLALHDCQAMYSSTDRVLVKWIDPTLPSGATIDRYVITVDGKQKYEITDAELDAYGYRRAEVPCGAGQHTITLYAVATDSDGREWESVHQDLEVTISANTDLFFFEDLCDSQVDESVMAYIYSHDTVLARIWLTAGWFKFAFS